MPLPWQILLPEVGKELDEVDEFLLLEGEVEAGGHEGGLHLFGGLDVFLGECLTDRQPCRTFLPELREPLPVVRCLQPFAPSLGVAKERQRPIEQPQGWRPSHARITKIARNRGF